MTCGCLARSRSARTPSEQRQPLNTGSRRRRHPSGIEPQRLAAIKAPAPRPASLARPTQAQQIARHVKASRRQAMRGSIELTRSRCGFIPTRKSPISTSSRTTTSSTRNGWLSLLTMRSSPSIWQKSARRSSIALELTCGSWRASNGSADGGASARSDRAHRCPPRRIRFRLACLPLRASLRLSGSTGCWRQLSRYRRTHPVGSAGKVRVCQG